MILNICDNSNILKVVRFAKILIDIIKIAVPIILILSLSIEYMIAVKKDDHDALAKATRNAVRKIIAAFAVFLIPSLISFLIMVSNAEQGTAFYCIRNATLSNIHLLATKEATEALATAKDSLNLNDYNYAKDAIDNMQTSTEKTNLENQLEIVHAYISIKDAISSLQIEYDEKRYEEITKKIEQIKDKDVKEKLYKLLEEAGKGRPLNAQAGTYKNSSSNLTYYVNLPEKATTNMPLIMYLHGDGGSSGAPSSPLYKAAVNYFGKNFPFIIVAPAGGMWAETNGRLSELKSIIDTVCKQYSCDTKKISITGHSRGSIGTWHMVNNYPNFFYSAVPVSCGSYKINPSNFLGTKLRAYAGTSGSDEIGYNRAMSSNVSKIKAAGGDATFYSLSGKSHGTSISAAYSQATLLWMIE